MAAGPVSWRVSFYSPKPVQPPDPGWFHAKPDLALPRRLGVPPEYAVVPFRLEPTPNFAGMFAKTFKAFRLFGGRHPRPPYDLPDVMGGRRQATFTAFVYPPNIVSLDVRVAQDMSIEELLSESFTVLLSPKNEVNSNLDAFIQALLERVSGCVGETGTYDWYPIVNIERITSAEAQESVPADNWNQWIHRNRDALIRLLLRNSAGENMRSELVSRLIVKCEELNFKSASSLFLVDKQGMLVASPLGESPVDQRNRRLQLQRSSELAAVAQVYQMVLSRYLSARSSNPAVWDFMLSRIRDWSLHSNALLTPSATNQHLWRILKDEFRIDAKLDLLLSRAYVRESLDRAARSNDELGVLWSRGLLRSANAETWTSEAEPPHE